MQQIYNLKKPFFFLFFILTVSVSLLSLIANTNQALDTNKPKNRHNLFEPIYAYDDIDTHTVSVDKNEEPSPPRSASGSTIRSTTTTANRQQQQQFGDKLLKPTPAVVVSQRPQTTTVRDDGEPTLSRFKSLPTEIQRNKKEIASSSTQRKALIAPNFGSSARLLDSRNAKLVNDFDSQQLPGQPKQEQPAHWSALENYYQKLRLTSSVPKQQSQPIDYQPIYQILQQHESDDSLNGGYRPLSTQGSTYTSPLNNNNNNAYVTSSKSPSAFLLPISTGSSAGVQSQQQLPTQTQLINSVNVNGLLPNVDADYAGQSYSSPTKQYAPGISRAPVIGSGSILQDRFTQEQIQIANQQAGNSNSQQQQLLRNQWLQAQLAAGGVVGSGSGARELIINPQSSLASGQPILIGGNEDGRVKYLEWRKLPELLLIQQQQQRAKHQQETFGPWYDHQRSKELLLEEAYCGPRNYLNFNVATINQPSVKSSGKIQYSPISISKLQQALEGQDIPVTLNAGEYPSHMGIYNGSRPNDDNFLCAATWIHEQYALTLASCFKNIRDTSKLTVRSGEWLMNKFNTSGTTNDPQQKAMLIREIEQIHLFPKYRNDSLEHNLAIIKFNKPIEFLDTQYICPACQMQSRTSLRTSSCWAPVRNITMTEYFDAEGEGETKEKKNVAMIEVPVKLIANDDNECYRQTRIEFFNFQHPNYICSADYRTSRWRARLNESEYFGSGIYCNEGGNLSLVSILHPIQSNSSSTYGYMDLSYYKPWMRNIISGRSF